MVLLLLRAPPSIAGAGVADQEERVFTAVIVFVHPLQQLTTIREATTKLLSLGETWKTENMSALCRLPRIDVGWFYPSAVSDAYLVLPYMSTAKGGPRKLQLDSPMVFNQHILVCKLHRWTDVADNVVVLPLVFLTDPTLPALRPVGHRGRLWVNTLYTSPVATAGTGLQSIQPAISVVSFGPEEVHTGKSMVSLYGSEVVYPPDVEVLPEPVSELNDELSEDNKATSITSKSEQSSSEDSSKDSSSNGGSSSSSSEEAGPKLKAKPKSKHACSGEVSANSEEDAPTKKKKRVKAKSDEGSDDEKGKANPPGDKNSSSGSDGSGGGDSGSNGGRGGTPNPGWPFPNLPTMDMLEKLGNDLYKYSRELFNDLEQTSMEVYDKVFDGFQDTGGIARNFCCKVTAITINFFHKAEQLEENLESLDQVRFKIALNKMREQITEMMERAAQAETVYK